MAQDIIEIIGNDQIELLYKAAGGAEDLLKVIKECNDQGKQLEKSFGAIGGTGNLSKLNQLTKEAQENQTRYTKSIQDLIKVNIENEKLTQQQEKTAQQSIKTKQEQEKADREIIKTLREKIKAQEEISKALKREAADLAKSQSAYAQLNKEYLDAARLAKDLAVTHGIESDQAKKAANSANELNGRLKAIDATIGVHTRNVGNYASGFNGLQVSINQLSRELPNFAQNVQTGFLAISNNIPMLADEIKRIIAANKELVAQGKPTESVFKQLASAVFGWQTALSLGIVLLTAYGKDIVDFFRGITTASKKAEEANKKYAESIKSINDNMIQSSNTEIAQLKVLEAVATSETATRKKRIEATREMIKLWPNALKGYSDEAIMAGQAASAIDGLTKSIMANAASEAFRQKYGAASVKEATLINAQYKAVRDLSNAETELFKVRKFGKGDAEEKGLNEFTAIGKVDEAKKALEDVNKLLTQAKIEKQFFLDNAVKSANEAGDLLTKGAGVKTPKLTKDYTLQAERDLTKEIADQLRQRATDEIETNKAISEDYKQALEDRMAAFKRTQKLREDIVIYTYDEEVNSANIALNRIADIERKATGKRSDEDKKLLANKEVYNAALLSAEDKKNAALSHLRREEAKDEEEFYNGLQKIVTDQYDNIRRNVESKKTEELLALKKKYEEHNITFEQYKKEEKAINDKYQLQILKDTLEFLAHEIKAFEALGMPTSKLKEAYEEISAAIGQMQAKIGEATNDNMQQAVKTLEKISSMASEAADIISAFYDYEVQYHQQAIQRINEEKDARIAAVNDSYMSDREKKEAIARINAEAHAKEVERIHEINKLKRRQAVAEKAAGILGAVVNTVKAVTKDLGDFPYPLNLAIAAIDAALGAAQIARIAAQPIPQYAKGTDSAKGGLSIVGEKGTEMVETPSGERFFTPPTETMMDIPKYSKIYTHEQTMKFVKDANLGLYPVANSYIETPTAIDLKPLLDETNEQNKLLRKILNKEPVSVTDGSFNIYYHLNARR